MEIFYSRDIDGSICRLDAEESAHCIKVLRHRSGDMINVIDGNGTLHRCTITDDSPKGAMAEIAESIPGWGSHPYHLTLAVSPTKNSDRYEWFAEKACEVGVDRICPVIGQHSERKVFKTSRVEKILVSATKQSLKSAIPEICEPVGVKDFIMQYGNQHIDTGSRTDDGKLRLIAYCFEDDTHRRTSIMEAINAYRKSIGTGGSFPEVTVMIGPEGDFSVEEADLAMKYGFIPVHLGPSRLRTETAAVTAAEAAYFSFLL
ncbi:MAG: 16S rRNA (uracil(1498)-N(3))-methyltransferase [Clostridium sp.]|nr:16S rRNA (uracil(1498)-N(3))-methyltransferase [Bacteroides sp.]MCM1197391.1 16S rRNA (uracil(1498)-N(3))-methyltransferase [Clostridium sp.]